MITTAVSLVLFATLLTCVELQWVTETVLCDSANFKNGKMELEALIMINESYSGDDIYHVSSYCIWLHHTSKSAIVGA